MNLKAFMRRRVELVRIQSLIACRSAHLKKPQSHYGGDMQLVYLEIGFWTETAMFFPEVEYFLPVVVALQSS